MDKMKLRLKKLKDKMPLTHEQGTRSISWGSIRGHAPLTIAPMYFIFHLLRMLSNRTLTNGPVYYTKGAAPLVYQTGPRVWVRLESIY